MTASGNRHTLRVQLVTKPGSAATGIGRYASEIDRGLTAAGVMTRNAELRNPVPRFVSGLGRRFGYDIEAFGRSFPLRADLDRGYLTHLTSQTLATILVAPRVPHPVVVTVHDILPYLLRNDARFSVYRHRLDRAMDALAMRGLKRANRLIADSHFTKSTVIDVLGVSLDKIDVVHLGVDSGTFRPMDISQEFLERYHLDRERPYLLFVGSEDPRKDLVTLLRALAKARSRVPDLALIKVGAPAFEEQRAAHLRLCAELGVAEAVRWVGAVPETDLPAFYNLASVFAFPSRYEGFGLPVLEAMACGTTVVAADASSVPELTGSHAHLVAPGDPDAFADALVAALEHPADGGTLVGHATSFTWQRTLAQTIDVYDRTMQESGGRPR